MFFRRERPKVPTFEERLDSVRNAGISVGPLADGGRVRVRRNNCAAVIEDVSGIPRVSRAGVMIGDEIGLVVDGGYQKFLQVPGGKRLPALASDLKALHDFQEDLREALGLESLYNESLGTVCDRHVYDRLEGRE